jgi:hypothetical protein
MFVGESWHSKQAKAHLQGAAFVKHPDPQVCDELAKWGVQYPNRPTQPTAGGRADLMYWVIVALILVIPTYALAPQVFSLSSLDTGAAPVRMLVARILH